MNGTYEIRCFDPLRGAVTRETVHAQSADELRRQRLAAGFVVLSLKIVRKGAANSGRARLDAGWWCRELRTLLRAGMTAVEAIETLLVQSRGGGREEVHRHLLWSLKQGQSLSQAMKGAGVFPDVLVAGVTASERTGGLVAALDDFLRYHELLQGLRSKVVSAAIYPAAVVAIGLAVSLFLLLYVVPRFSRMYVDFKGAVSLPTKWLMSFSAVVTDYSGVALALLMALGVIAIFVAKRIDPSAILHLLQRTLPAVDRQWDHYRRAKLYHSLALMVRGGYPLDESLLVCEGLRLDRRTDAGIATARTLIRQGKPVAFAFASGGLTDAVAERLLAVGERTGEFDAVLQTIAERHASSFSTVVERATRLVEPLLLLLVAVIVGGIVVMMYMPIFDIASGVR